jgi:hypothetical protein
MTELVINSFRDELEKIAGARWLKGSQTKMLGNAVSQYKKGGSYNKDMFGSRAAAMKDALDEGATRKWLANDKLRSSNPKPSGLRAGLVAATGKTPRVEHKVRGKLKAFGRGLRAKAKSWHAK